MRSLHGLWLALGFGAMAAGCVSVGPPPTPVLIAGREASEGSTRWYLGAEGGRLFSDAESPTGSGTPLHSRDFPHARERLRSGIEFGLLEPGLASEVFGSSGSATLVTYVLHGSPAWLSGLRRGDRVLAVDGTSPQRPEGLVAFIGAGAPGHRMSLEVEGWDGHHTFEFELAEDVEAHAGIDLSILFGSEGWCRRWDSWALAGLGWWSNHMWWETQEREPAGRRYTGVLWGALSYRRTPDGAWLGLLGVISIPLPL